MTRAAQIERLRGLVAAISKELEVLAADEPPSTPQKSSGPSAAALERVARMRATREQRRGRSG